MSKWKDRVPDVVYTEGSDICFSDSKRSEIFRVDSRKTGSVVGYFYLDNRNVKTFFVDAWRTGVDYSDLVLPGKVETRGSKCSIDIESFPIDLRIGEERCLELFLNDDWVALNIPNLVPQLVWTRSDVGVSPLIFWFDADKGQIFTHEIHFSRPEVWVHVGPKLMFSLSGCDYSRLIKEQ